MTNQGRDKTLFEEHPELLREIEELHEYLRKTGQLGKIKID